MPQRRGRHGHGKCQEMSMVILILPIIGVAMVVAGVGLGVLYLSGHASWTPGYFAAIVLAWTGIILAFSPMAIAVVIAVRRALRPSGQRERQISAGPRRRRRRFGTLVVPSLPFIGIVLLISGLQTTSYDMLSLRALFSRDNVLGRSLFWSGLLVTPLLAGLLAIPALRRLTPRVGRTRIHRHCLRFFCQNDR